MGETSTVAAGGQAMVRSEENTLFLGKHTVCNETGGD